MLCSDNFFAGINFLFLHSNSNPVECFGKSLDIRQYVETLGVSKIFKSFNLLANPTAGSADFFSIRLIRFEDPLTFFWLASSPC